jgi:hypothetical protein
MTSLQLKPVFSQGLQIEPGTEDTTVVVRFAGNADLRNREVLERTLREIHGELLQLAAREVVVDFMKLEFMNSSCFKSFISWISWLQGTEEDVRYCIRFRMNQAIHWQKRSLHALKCFAADLVSIEPS